MGYNLEMARATANIRRRIIPPLAPGFAGGGLRSPRCRSRPARSSRPACHQRRGCCPKERMSTCWQLRDVTLHAYGNNLGFDATTALTTLLYSGEHFDQRIAMQYLRARYYDPAAGRFNRLDPFFGRLTDPQSLHKYLYVHGDPIARVDPRGLDGTLITTLKAAAIQGTLRGLQIGVVGGLLNGGIAWWQGGSFWRGFAWGFCMGFAIGFGIGFIGGATAPLWLESAVVDAST